MSNSPVASIFPVTTPPLSSQNPYSHVAHYIERHFSCGPSVLVKFNGSLLNFNKKC